MDCAADKTLAIPNSPLKTRADWQREALLSQAGRVLGPDWRPPRPTKKSTV